MTEGTTEGMFEQRGGHHIYFLVIHEYYYYHYLLFLFHYYYSTLKKVAHPQQSQQIHIHNTAILSKLVTFFKQNEIILNPCRKEAIHMPHIALRTHLKWQFLICSSSSTPLTWGSCTQSHISFLMPKFTFKIFFLILTNVYLDMLCWAGQ